MFKYLPIAALALLFNTAIAQSVEQSFVNNDGEYLYVESRDNNKAFPAVVAVIEKAGYSRRTHASAIPPGTKLDTWCKVDVYRERQILGECYTPQMGHGISVRNDLAWTREQFRGDYSDVPVMIAKIRDEHRQVSVILGIK